MNLHHSIPFTSACGTPDYTNFVSAFHGCLDYIYIDSDELEVSKVIPLPDHEDILKYTALPNEAFPSDHLALVCDVNWKHK